MRAIKLATVFAVMAFAAPALAQGPPPSPPTAPPPAAAAPTAPVAASAGKRDACRQVTAGLRGQERRDQMQLCVAQGQLDCVTQAINQKTAGPQRKEFMRTCMGTPPRGDGGL